MDSYDTFATFCLGLFIGSVGVGVVAWYFIRKYDNLEERIRAEYDKIINKIKNQCKRRRIDQQCAYNYINWCV